jgi:hypothetical protein
MSTFGTFGQYQNSLNVIELLVENNTMLREIEVEVADACANTVGIVTGIAENTSNAASNATAITSIIADVSINKIDTSSNEADISNNIVPLIPDISQNKVDISNNQGAITSIMSDISNNQGDIAINTAAIVSFMSDISINQNDIASNQATITSIIADVSINILDISSVIADVSINKIDIATNIADMSSVLNDVSQNVFDISTNQTNISTNVVDISTNENRLTILENVSEKFLYAHRSTDLIFDVSNITYDISFDTITRANSIYTTTNLDASGEFIITEAGLYKITLQMSSQIVDAAPLERLVLINLNKNGTAIDGGLLGVSVWNNNEINSGELTVLQDLSGGEVFKYTWDQDIDGAVKILANTCRLIVEKIIR